MFDEGGDGKVPPYGFGLPYPVEGQVVGTVAAQTAAHGKPPRGNIEPEFKKSFYQGMDTLRWRNMKKPYWVYMLECAGGFLYTGVAIDPDARFLEHRAGKGSRFTRMRKPLRILGRRQYSDRGAALRVEHALKKLTPAEKRRWAAE
jgi:putative endonuclease